MAVNALASADRLKPLDFSPIANAHHEVYRTTAPLDLRGPVFLAALALFLLDSLVVLFWVGASSDCIPRRSRAAAAMWWSAWRCWRLSVRTSPRAGLAELQVPPAALQTRLAYVVTGDANVDSISKAGLAGLTLFLAQRTALEAGDPIGLDIAHDELAFYPLIYWPIVPGAPRPPDEALKRIDSYMKNGGTVLFDTRDAIDAPPGVGGETRSPGMARVAQDFVLARHSPA